MTDKDELSDQTRETLIVCVYQILVWLTRPKKREKRERGGCILSTVLHVDAHEEKQTVPSTREKRVCFLLSFFVFANWPRFEYPVHFADADDSKGVMS